MIEMCSRFSTFVYAAYNISFHSTNAFLVKGFISNAVCYNKREYKIKSVKANIYLVGFIKENKHCEEEHGVFHRINLYILSSLRFTT